MQWIGYLIIFIGLLCVTITDLRCQKIWLPVPVLGMVLLLVYHGVFHEKIWMYMVSGGCYLGVFAGISKITGGQMGLGDAFIIGFAGTGLGFTDTFLLVYVGFLLAMAVSVFLLFKKKGFRYRLPFSPFLFVAYLGIGMANHWFFVT